MKTLRAASAFLVKKLWSLIAFAVVLVALVISLLRYALPYLNDHKDYVQSYISKQYSVEISIGELSASWQNSGPALVLREVLIAKGDQSPIELSVGEIFLEVEFWPSLFKQSLQSNQIVLNRLDLELDLPQLKQGDSDFPILQALENVFLSQLSNFLVSNSRLTLNSELHTKSIQIEKLSWLNEGNRHQGVGAFALEDFSNNKAQFILDLKGDVRRYNGTLYANAQDINLAAWINEYTGLQNELADSKGNFEVWAQIQNSEFVRLDGEILPTSLTWQRGETVMQNELTARFAAEKKQNSWDFLIKDAEFKNSDSVLTSEWAGNYVSPSSFFVELKDAIDLSPLKSLVPIYSIELADQLALSRAKAEVSSIQLWATGNDTFVQAQVDKIGWREQNLVPGVSDLSAKIYWHNNTGKVHISAEQKIIEADGLFDRVFTLSNFDMPIFFNLDGERNSLAIETSEITVDELDISLQAEYGFTDQFLSLNAKVRDALSLKQVKKFLPKQLMGENTRKYLVDALMGKGTLNKGSLLYHGKTSDFPFTQQEGVFQSELSIDSADFLFSKDWPHLHDLDVDLHFKNSGLELTSKKAKLQGISVSEIRAAIPNLSAGARLDIKASTKAQGDIVSSLFLDSPLSATLGPLLQEQVIFSGELAGELQLDIPLSQPQKTVASGSITFDSNDILLTALQLNLRESSGELTFINDKIELEIQNALLLGQPVELSLNGEQAERFYSINANMQGFWDGQGIIENTVPSLSAYANGDVGWNLDVDVQLTQNDFEYAAVLKSSLQGLELNLPAPYYKAANESQALIVNSRGDKLASVVELSLGEELLFDGVLAHQERKFNRAHLALGKTEFETRGVGFSISGELKQIDFEPWYEFVKSITQTVAQTNESPLLSAPQRMFVNVERLGFAGYTLSDLNLNVKQLMERWDIELDSDQLRASVNVFDQLYSKGIQIDAEYLRLPKQFADNERQTISASDFDPKTLPTINFTCKSCELFGYDFGRVEIEAEPNSDGLKISQLLFDNENGRLNASGQWYKRNDDHYTFIAGDLGASDFGEFIQNFGFDSGIKDSSADLDFALTWQNSPLDIELENIDGEITWQLSDGYLTEVSDKGSRIFSLLSLNSLVRKLSLDFRDVFAKGFFYDSMQGSLQITEGKADTRDTNIDGAAGEIEIYGNTDLAKQTLNYNVSFTPNVTGNLPFLMFFTVSPPSAIAALAIDQVLTSAKVISNINYSVTGTFSEPILIETGRESTEVDLPARRSTEEKKADDFVAPTEQDLLKIEVDDGRSD